MTARLLFPRSVFDSVQADLLSTPRVERAAIGFAGRFGTGTRQRLLVRAWEPVPDDEYLVQLAYHLEVSPVFWARAAKRAQRTGESLVIAHSHPGEAHVPEFSPSDDYGERQLIPKLQARAPVPIAALVLGPHGQSARLHDGKRRGGKLLHVRLVGEPPRSDAVYSHDQRYHRQALALGADGQGLLRTQKIGVVGAGGTGSHVVQQLLHLGVGQIVVLDPDQVDETNLSRLVGARTSDATKGVAKVRVMERIASALGNKSRLRAASDTIVQASGAEQLLDCDLVFGCTDSQWARLVLNALAFQYYVPVVDVGVELQAGGAMGGRVSWLLPGLPCLWCRGVLDSTAVRVEQLSPDDRAEQARRGYVPDFDVAAPAVVSVNGVVASLAVTEFLARLTGFTGDRDRPIELAYRLADGVVRRCLPSSRPDCLVCSNAGALGAGVLAPAPWRIPS